MSGPFSPRKNDLPRKELEAMAQSVLGPSSVVYFKWTCENCGARCTFEEGNTLYEEGECYACRHVQKVEYGGFAVVLKIGEDK